MKRLILYLPICLVGIPLLISLLVASAPSNDSVPADSNNPPAVPVVSDEGALPDSARMEKLASEDPTEFVKNCVRRYQREVKGYTLIMQKQERLRGRLYPRELLEVAFRENPFSVYLHWIEGARKADRVAYVEGENGGKMLIHPAGIAGRFVKVVRRDIGGEEAKDSGRYTIDKFGIKNGTLRTLASMEAAKKKGTLHVDYQGEKKVIEAGNRLCYKLVRKYDEPENDGVMNLTIYVDKETWLQIGSVVKGNNNQIIGEYYFRDIHLNPEFRPGQFKEAAVAP